MPIKSFNPRAHEGRDLIHNPVLSAALSFNPRAHEGRDFGAAPLRGNVKCFNPRAHEGRDSLGPLGNNQ